MKRITFAMLISPLVVCGVLALVIVVGTHHGTQPRMVEHTVTAPTKPKKKVVASYPADVDVKFVRGCVGANMALLDACGCWLDELHAKVSWQQYAIDYTLLNANSLPAKRLRFYQAMWNRCLKVHNPKLTG